MSGKQKLEDGFGLVKEEEDSDLTMDLPPELAGAPLAPSVGGEGVDNPGIDFDEIVESIYYEKGLLQGEHIQGLLPDSPPDSSSERYQFSPSSSSATTDINTFASAGSILEDQHMGAPMGAAYSDRSLHLDLDRIDYTAPLQLIEGGMVYKTENEQDRPKRKRKEPAPSAPTAPMRSNIRFGAHTPSSWHRLLTQDRRELCAPKLTVSADKGFNFSPLDDSFIAQKKNHFQLSVQIEPLPIENSPLAFVRTRDGALREIQGIQINFYGIKLDVPTSYIRVEQSQTDRSKVPFHPAPVTLTHDRPTKLSIGRLHFTETTANNMRKKGRPNPAQKYFQLVVSLEAVLDKGAVCLSAAASERIIVRASNPGQFESEGGSEVRPEPVAPAGSDGWMREGGSVYHLGKVGINTNAPSESLSVRGNIQLTGQILQPSDLRIKEKVREVDSRTQLENVNRIKIVQYKYKSEFVQQLLPTEQQQHEQQRSQTGVIAQDVRRVLPDAVSSAGTCTLGNGTKVDDMLIVNKDRLFLENIGAVRELSKMTDTLENRIDDLEKANEKVSVRLSRLRKAKPGSSVATGGGGCSSSTSSEGGSEAPSEEFERPRRTRTKSCSSTTPSLASQLLGNRPFRILLLLLCLVMAVSLSAIAVVYIMAYFRGDGNVVVPRADEVEYRIVEEEETTMFERSEEIDFTPTRLRTTTTTTNDFRKTTSSPPTQSTSATAIIPALLTTTTATTTTELPPLEPPTPLGPPSCDGGSCLAPCCSTRAPTPAPIDAAPTEEAASDNIIFNNPADVLMVLEKAEPNKEKFVELLNQEAEEDADARLFSAHDSKEQEVEEEVKDDDDDPLFNLTLSGPGFAHKTELENELPAPTSSGSDHNEVTEGSKDKGGSREIRVLVRTSQELEAELKEQPKPDKSLNEVTGPDKAINEVDDIIVPSSSEKYNEVVTTTERQRAKRNVKNIVNMVSNMIRRIRNTDETEEAAMGKPQGSQGSLALLTGSGGSHVLDERYCESEDRECRLNLAGAANVSLSVPLSKCFRDDSLQLRFPVAVIACEEGVAGPPSSVVGLTLKSELSQGFRFRVAVEGGSESVCDQQPGSAAFREYNVNFYRVC